MEVSIVRTEENRVLVQTSRQAYIAVFEVVPGRGVSLVYPAALRLSGVKRVVPRDPDRGLRSALRKRAGAEQGGRRNGNPGRDWRHGRREL